MAEQDPEVDLAANIIGIPAYEAPRPKQRKFLPWHRPRKQYVRVEQWCAEIKILLESRDAVPSVLKYLGLPGIDLLDLRYIHKTICAPSNLSFAFLGFNTALASNEDDQTEINISLDEVRRLAMVDEASDVLKDDIRLLADTNSLAFQTARGFGPFDVINLDLCDGFAKHEPGTVTLNHYQALAGILKIQLLSKSPWLLLLTTRVGHQDVHEELLKIFLDVYGKNLDANDIFRAMSTKTFGIGKRSEMVTATATERGHVDLFLTGLCKWMSLLAIENNPTATIDVRSVMGYKVAPLSTCEDLISVAIKFAPNPAIITDPTGIISADRGQLPDESKIAVASLRKVAARSDVDKILSEEKQIHEIMLAEMADLLKSARYDPADYVKWASAEQATA